MAGIEPATPCLQSRYGKTLKCFDGVAYTGKQQNSRSPNVPKLYLPIQPSPFLVSTSHRRPHSFGKPGGQTAIKTAPIIIHGT